MELDEIEDRKNWSRRKLITILGSGLGLLAVNPKLILPAPEKLPLQGYNSFVVSLENGLTVVRSGGKLIKALPTTAENNTTLINEAISLAATYMQPGRYEISDSIVGRTGHLLRGMGPEHTTIILPKFDPLLRRIEDEQLRKIRRSIN